MVKLQRGDYLILLFSVLLLPTLYFNLWGDRFAGEYVSIIVGSEQVELLSLQQPQKIEIQGSLGLSLLEIFNGKVRFIDSACQGKQCVHSGWIHQGGEVVSCLPNRISIAILSGEQRFDSINF